MKIVYSKDCREYITPIVREVHLVERIISEALIFKSVIYPFKSPFLQSALNEVRHARMFGGDCLRLIVDSDPRTKVYFNPSEYGACYKEEIPSHFLEQDELGVLQDLKSNLRTSLYTILDTELMLFNDVGDSLTKYLSEFLLYHNEFKVHIKKADQNLSLRLGEIYNG